MKSIAIITRTINRPLTLRRTMLSIVNQEFKDLKWVIVNDGGQTQTVDQILIEALASGIEASAIHNKTSFGRKAASNTGIKQSKSKYIVLLDDDDTWHPEFLTKCIRFLENPINSSYKGVVTNTLVVEEEITDKEILTNKTYPFDANLSAITLFRVAKFKSFPNLSFVYRRDALEEIGLYREDLPVLGDWEFNLRFLTKFDIGFIPEYLANYHQRKKSKKDSYTQSDIDHIHIATYTKIKNELLRKDLENNTVGLGFLVNIGDEINQLERIIKRGSMRWILQNMLNNLKLTYTSNIKLKNY
ncbi:glycosyltransferase family 2 protein [Methylomonas sp. MgM2]